MGMSRRQKEGLDGWATKNCASLQNAMYYLTDKMEGTLKAGKRVLRIQFRNLTRCYTNLNENIVSDLKTKVIKKITSKLP